MRPRLIVLNVIGVALLAAAWWAGVLGLLWTADRVHSAPIIGSVVVLGLFYAWAGKWDTVGWLGKLLPLFGLFLTSYGILTIAPASAGGGDYFAIRTMTIEALTPNCIAGVCVLWLMIVRRVCDVNEGRPMTGYWVHLTDEQKAKIIRRVREP